METEELQGLLQSTEAISVVAAKVALRERAKPLKEVDPDQMDDESLQETHFLVARKEADGSRVTSGDVLAQKFIEESLMDILPDSTFRGEESKGGNGYSVPEGYHWLADPVDGTNSYIRGKDPAKHPEADLRRFASMISLSKGKDKQLAALFVPDVDATPESLSGTLYSATKDTPTMVTPVRDGKILRDEAVKASDIKPANAKRFASGRFDPSLLGSSQPWDGDVLGDKMQEGMGKRGYETVAMHSFGAAAGDVIEKKSLCANGVNCEWDCIPTLLFRQAGIPFASFRHARPGSDGNQRFVVMAAPDKDDFEQLNTIFSAHYADSVVAPSPEESANTYWHERAAELKDKSRRPIKR